MKLYLISQDVNDYYDTYDSAVVAAESDEDARSIHPDGESIDWQNAKSSLYSTWAPLASDVKVKCIGVAAPGIERGVICASYNSA